MSTDDRTSRQKRPQPTVAESGATAGRRRSTTRSRAGEPKLRAVTPVVSTGLRAATRTACRSTPGDDTDWPVSDS